MHHILIVSAGLYDKLLDSLSAYWYFADADSERPWHLCSLASLAPADRWGEAL